MKKIILLLFISSNYFCHLNAQEMNNDKLDLIFNAVSEQIEGGKGSWRFIIDSTMFICITDEIHNRMRIISPIKEVAEVSNEEMKRCMEANFHTALDVKYAFSDDVLWSAFVHPLKELTEDQLISGLSQVYSCVKTYGKEYSGGFLSFPTAKEQEQKEKEKERKIRRN